MEGGVERSLRQVGSFRYDGIFLVYSGVEWNSLMEHNLGKIVGMGLKRQGNAKNPSNITVIDSICSVNLEKGAFLAAHPTSPSYQSWTISPAESVRRQVLGTMGYELDWKGPKVGIPRAICVVPILGKHSRDIVSAADQIAEEYDLSFYVVPKIVLRGETPTLPLENILTRFSIR